MKIELDIYDETVSHLMATVLTNQYEGLKQDIINLQGKKSLLPYQQFDLDYDLEMIKHMKHVLEYNGVTVD